MPHPRGRRTAMQTHSKGCVSFRHTQGPLGFPSSSICRQGFWGALGASSGAPSLGLFGGPSCAWLLFVGSEVLRAGPIRGPRTSPIHAQRDVLLPLCIRGQTSGGRIFCCCHVTTKWDRDNAIMQDGLSAERPLTPVSVWCSLLLEDQRVALQFPCTGISKG